MLEVISVVDYFGRIHARAGCAFAEGICVADTFSIFRSQPYLLTPASSVYSTDFCHPTKAGPLGAAPWRHRCGAIRPRAGGRGAYAPRPFNGAWISVYGIEEEGQVPSTW